MIQEQFVTYLTPAYLAGAAVVILVLACTWNVVSYSRKFYAAGGVSGPRLSNDPITGTLDVLLPFTLYRWLTHSRSWMAGSHRSCPSYK